MARDARGREVLPDDRRAARYCLNGALVREGALLDRKTLRLRRRATPGDIGVDDVTVSPTGLLAVRVFGTVLAELLSAGGLGERLGGRFVYASPRGRRERPIVLRQLAEALNDDPSSRHHDVARLLRDADRLLTRELARRRAGRAATTNDRANVDER